MVYMSKMLSEILDRDLSSPGPYEFNPVVDSFNYRALFSDHTGSTV